MFQRHRARRDDAPTPTCWAPELTAQAIDDFDLPGRVTWSRAQPGRYVAPVARWQLHVGRTVRGKPMYILVTDRSGDLFSFFPMVKYPSGE